MNAIAAVRWPEPGSWRMAGHCQSVPDAGSGSPAGLRRTDPRNRCRAATETKCGNGGSVLRDWSAMTTDAVKARLAAALRRRLGRGGLATYDLAARIGCSNRTVEDWLMEASAPSLTLFGRIVVELGADFEAEVWGRPRPPDAADIAALAAALRPFQGGTVI